MKYFKSIILIFFLLNYSSISFAADVYFIDMRKILNESKAGKQAQDFLKKRFESENKKYAAQFSMMAIVFLRTTVN